MRLLATPEINAVEGGYTFTYWEVVGFSALSSGLAFGTMEMMQLSLYQGLKSGIACAIPTGIASAILLTSYRYFPILSA